MSVSSECNFNTKAKLAMFMVLVSYSCLEKRCIPETGDACAVT